LLLAVSIERQYPRVKPGELSVALRARRRKWILGLASLSGSRRLVTYQKE
jgi:hypothetical protein